VLPTAHLVTFCVTSLALIVAPGPSVLFIISRALSLGRRAALATVVGNEAGEYVQVIAVAFGVGVLVERSIVVFTLVKVVGAVYLVFLGWRTLRDRRGLAGLADVAPRATGRVLREGFVVGVSNPVRRSTGWACSRATALPRRRLPADGLGMRQRLGVGGGHRPVLVGSITAAAGDDRRCRRPGDHRPGRSLGRHRPPELTVGDCRAAAPDFQHGDG
jgi:hypothetical protein